MGLLYCIPIPAGIGLISAFQQDGQGLLVGDLGPGLELGERAGLPIGCWTLVKG